MHRLLTCALALQMAGCEDTIIEALGRGVCGQGVAAQSELARPADQLLNSFGIQVHFAYLEYANFDKVIADLGSLGIRHLRDDSNGSTPGSMKVAGIKEAGRRGIRTQLRLVDGADIEDLLETLGPAIEAVEVPTPGQALNSSSTSDILGRAKALHAAIKALPASRRVELVGPLLMQQSGVETIPSLAGIIDAGATWYPRPATPANIAAQVDRARIWAPGLPLVNVFGQHYPVKVGASEVTVTPDQQARYVLRFYLEQFRAGIVRAYYSQLYDAADPFGYAVATGDGVPRPSFLAIKALANILTDLGPPQPAVPVAYRLETGGQEVSDDVHHLILRRSDGTYVLLLWLEVPGNPEPTTRTITVRMGNMIDNVKMDPLTGLEGASQTLANINVMDIVVSDHPLALTFKVVCP